MGFSRQEYWSGLPFPSSGVLPDLRIKLTSLALAGRFFTTEPPGKALGAAAAAKLLQSCLTLCNPIDGSPPGSPVPGILQAKNTGVGCHFLLQCMKVKSESEVAQLCLTLPPHGLQPTRLLCPWDFPGKSTGVGCHYRESNQQFVKLITARVFLIYLCVYLYVCIFI